MKRFLIFLILLSTSSPAFSKNRISEFIGGPIQNWTPPVVEKSKLENGFQLYLLEDGALPIFQAKLFIQVGSTHDPITHSGLSELTANLLIGGGTLSKTPQEVDEWLDEQSIHLDVEVDQELTVITISSLAPQWERALDFLWEVVWQPRWDSERFQLFQRQAEEALRREEDQPDLILSKAFQKTIYGEGHPWALYPTAQTLQQITIPKIKEYYQRYFHPNEMLLAMAGDFSKERVRKWFQIKGSPIPAHKVDHPNWSLIPFQNKSETKWISKELTQSFIEVGHLSLERHSEDRYAYGLLQYILGGDPFTSRLGKDIRKDQGLAYSVYSHWEANPVRGLFKVHVETKAENQGKVLQRIQGHLTRISQEGNITAEELQMAKEALLNQYIFLFDSPFKAVALQTRVDLLGFPTDYLQRYPQKVQAVTLPEVQEVAKKYLDPKGLKTVIVGPEDFQ